jgi:hypothetical protein
MSAKDQKQTFAAHKPMSALGHKQTYAVQNGMSALPPKATSNATDGDLRISGHPRRLCHQESDAATRGKVTLISVNSPGRVSTSIEPPCCFTMMS